MIGLDSIDPSAAGCGLSGCDYETDARRQLDGWCGRCREAGRDDKRHKPLPPAFPGNYDQVLQFPPIEVIDDEGWAWRSVQRRWGSRLSWDPTPTMRKSPRRSFSSAASCSTSTWTRSTCRGAVSLRPTREVELAALGALLVSVTQSQLLAPVLAAVRSWLGGSPQRSIKLELEGDTLELTGISSTEQRRLVDEWLQRHTPR